MRWLGVRDAETSRRRTGGGVAGSWGRFVAQVKIYDAKTGSKGVDAVRQIAGIAAAERKKAVFFATCRFSNETTKFVEAAGVLLLWFSAAGTGAELAPQTDFTLDFAVRLYSTRISIRNGGTMLKQAALDAVADDRTAVVPRPNQLFKHPREHGPVARFQTPTSGNV
ncbi:restriction endonuclease [Microterricola viridarii]|uniref:restriction endonuclease n=1 Tax=Microterricola viridarii TaxID=412690 RepID=UPI0012EA2B57|nr:restriction endonuclease [Microterricola viridarii]